MIPTFGAFGKMPALGDFFRIRIDAGFVGVWDAWLQDGLAAMRAALGERYDGAYLSAPIWRFALPAGVAGPGPAIGVLMPSLDRVGRHFPLTLCCDLSGLAPRAPALALLVQHAGLLDRAEALAIDMLGEQGATRDALDARLPGLYPEEPGSPAILRQEAGGLRIDGGTLSALPGALIAGLRAPPATETAWACLVDGESHLFTTPGLPGGADFQSLFDTATPFWTDAR